MIDMRSKSAVWGLLLLVPLFLLVLWSLSRESRAAGTEAQGILAQLSKERAKKTQPIEDPAKAMNNFYQALARTAARQPDTVTRICHFGDSLIEMELLPGPVRRLLQAKWGDSGHGFVLGSRPKPWYRPYDLEFNPSSDWISYDMGDRKIPDRRFGLGGATAIAYNANAKVEIGTVGKGAIGTKVSRFEIRFPIEPQGGLLEVLLDGKKVGTINTAGQGYQDGYAELRVPDGGHTLALVASKKNMRLHGVILERQGPGVVYDALGINGSGVQTYLSVDNNHWIEELRHRNPNLVLIGVGTNDTYNELNLQVYKKQMIELVNRARFAVPNATVMLIAPLDRAIKQGAQLVTHPVTPKIVAAQRELAKEIGIPFWSAFDAMGGEGSMARWYNANPRLGAGDLFHPTPKGGEVLGEMMYNALMQGFATYLEQNGVPTTPPPAPLADKLRKVEITK